jgi:hypothetical protein
MALAKSNAGENTSKPERIKKKLTLKIPDEKKTKKQ